MGGESVNDILLNLSIQVCHDCRDRIWQPIVALITTLVGGLVLVLVAIVFKLGVSPTMDSMLFFIQVG